MEVQLIKLNKIKVNDKNPRTITEDKLRRLIESILVFPKMLTIRPIVVDDKGVALGGNMRTRALKGIKKIGRDCIPERLQQIRQYANKTQEEKNELLAFWDAWFKEQTVPVIYADTLTEEEKRKFIIKDNSSFGAWDWDVLANEWDAEQLEDWGVDVWTADENENDAREVEVQEDDFDVCDEQPSIVKRGEVWKLGEHRLMCGDSTKAEDVARLMNGEQADLWITDPPYNVDYNSKNDYLNKVGKGGAVQVDIENDKMSDEDFRNFLHDAFSSANSVMKAGCPFYVWTAQGHAMTDIMRELDNVGLFFRQQLIWVKNNLVLGRMDYQGRHEPCLYGWKEGAHYFINSRNRTTVYEDGEEIDIDKLKEDEMKKLLHDILDSKTPTTVIDCPKPQRSADHPTMKPVRLFGYQIANSSRQGDIVLDSFGGSGTTMIACEQLNRKCRMMELDEHYCDVIIARWEKYTGNKAVKIE